MSFRRMVGQEIVTTLRVACARLRVSKFSIYNGGIPEMQLTLKPDPFGPPQSLNEVVVQFYGTPLIKTSDVYEVTIRKVEKAG